MPSEFPLHRPGVNDAELLDWGFRTSLHWSCSTALVKYMWTLLTCYSHRLPTWFLGSSDSGLRYYFLSYALYFSFLPRSTPVFWCVTGYFLKLSFEIFPPCWCLFLMDDPGNNGSAHGFRWHIMVPFYSPPPLFLTLIFFLQWALFTFGLERWGFRFQYLYYFYLDDIVILFWVSSLLAG